MRALLIGLVVAGCLWAADRKELDVGADQGWTDAGMDLQPGDSLTLNASGSMQLDATHTSGPDGIARLWTDLLMQYPVMNAGRGALIGRFTDNPAARAFLIGAHLERKAPVAGRLFLSINQQSGQTSTGSYHVIVERTKGSAAAAYGVRLPVFTQEMLDRLPVRVTDAFGNLGDRVNFMVIGSEERLQQALTEAGWVLVDKTRQEAILHGLITSLSKEGYVTMPMSPLMLFGRVQDFGYAQADPLMVVQSRHHFRIWKAPFTAEGETVWVGAGTHDVGFERDVRTNGVTHRIDPATDGERDYIGQGLQNTGFVVKEVYMTPTHPVREAKTATGGGFTSDGRTLVIYVR
jgi:hypothetical protein